MTTEASPPSWQLDPEARRRWQRIYAACALFLLLVGIGGAAWSLRWLGQPYPGAIWSVQIEKMRVVSFDFLPETTLFLRKAQEYRFGERIIAVDGIPVSESLPDYRQARPGERRQYTRRQPDGTLVEREISVYLYTFEHWFYSHGALLLVGLGNLITGWLLMLRVRNKPMLLLALIFLASAMAGVQHNWFGCISTCGRDAWVASLFAQTLLDINGTLTPALLLYFASCYPDDLYSPAFAKRLRFVGYALSTFFFIALTISKYLVIFTGKDITSLVIPSHRAYFGLVASLVALVVLWRTLRRPTMQYRLFGFVFVGGILILVVGSVLVFSPQTPTWFVNSVVYPTAILYPFLVYYAIHNTLLFSDLQTHLSQIQDLERELREVKRFRERSLREISNLLHDNVLSDLKGVQFILQALEKPESPYDEEEIREKMLFVEQSLGTTATRLRRIVEGVKPVNFKDEGLIKPLERLFETFRALHGKHLTFFVQIDERYDALPLTMQERIYTIVRLAASNTIEHAHASRFEARLYCHTKGDRTCYTIRLQDDGRGFDVERARQEAIARGHLGLANIEYHARAMGATCRIESAWGKGTYIEVVLDVSESSFE